MSIHKFNPWKKKYRPRTRPVYPTQISKELEPTRAERKRATLARIEQTPKEAA